MWYNAIELYTKYITLWLLPSKLVRSVVRARVTSFTYVCLVLQVNSIHEGQTSKVVDTVTDDARRSDK